MRSQTREVCTSSGYVVYFALVAKMEDRITTLWELQHDVKHTHNLETSLSVQWNHAPGLQKILYLESLWIFIKFCLS